MKKLLTSAGLVALGVSGLHAAYAPELSHTEASKPWSVSAALRGFYDDNYTASVSALAQDSFGYEFAPSVSLNLPLDQTFVSVSYEYSVKYYEARRSDKYDQSHKFDGRIDHAFSERYKIKVDDSFVISKEPDILAPSGTPLTSLRTDTDAIRNLGSVRFTAQMTELTAIELGYSNAFYDYDQNANDVPLGASSRSGLLDRLEHQASLDLRWQVMPDTDAILGYSFGMVDFTGNELIYLGPGLVKSDDRNARSHRVYVGADHRFNADLSASVRVGGQYTDYYNRGEDGLSPYADASVTYEYNQGSTIQVGITHSRNATDASSLDQETTVLYGSINHKITSKLTGSLLIQGQDSNFKGGTSDGETELFLISGLNLAYHFNPYLLAEAGYNFDRLDSDVANRSYSRNRVYLGVRATY